jgi:predicted RNase H-like HicB family nuclease
VPTFGFIGKIIKAYSMRQVILVPDPEEGGYTVEVPSLPGCISQGETIDEAVANIKEAIELYLEVLVEDGKPIPDDYPAPIQIVVV